jgi:hypothetical protein
MCIEPWFVRGIEIARIKRNAAQHKVHRPQTVQREASLRLALSQPRRCALEEVEQLQTGWKTLTTVELP